MKKTILTLAAAMLFILSAQAQTAHRFTLSNSADGKSRIDVFLPEHPTGRAVVACPGGGYSHLAMNHEGYDWAGYFNAQGIAYFVLTYRMPEGDRNIPLTDAYNAIKTVRDSAAVWNVNPYDVGIMGSSAGGHLASAVSTHAPFASRPDFTILFYPVISMDERETHRGSCAGFLGDKRSDASLVKEWSSQNAVRRHLTPPAIILLAGDDGTVPPLTNGFKYYEAMREAGNPCALYVYPLGGHGFGFRSSFPYHDQMLQEITTWLNNLPRRKADATRVACIGNSITDSYGIDMAAVNGYPAQLQKILGTDYHVSNFGVGGRTMMNHADWPYMREMAWADAKAFMPDVAIIKLGTNDTKPQNWKYSDEFGGDLQQMIDTLRSLPSNPRIILATPIVALSHNWDINDSIITAGVIPAIRNVAKKNKLEVLDYNTLFDYSDGKQILPDGIHPNVTGAKQMAQIAADFILTSKPLAPKKPAKKSAKKRNRK